ncbi:MAG TPA: recombinase family protein [Mucilaginibacter sp.]|nr:recombinase family protein [Mucilaginibacter sp.]
MNAIAYVRYASTAIEDGARIGYNPQENAIKDYCVANHINLCEIFHDIGVSGADFERQGWQQTEKYLDGVDGFIDC